MKSRRLDVELVERGLAESREQAQRLILAGEVWVEGQRWDKASKPCAASAHIEVRGAERYVSRGGFKLEGALRGFQLDVTGLRCLDLGASTGGFTDCLLQHGAREVVAVDVGHGQLHWRLRQDQRVHVHEGVNARDLAGYAREHFPGAFDLAVADVSFISLRLVLPPAFDLLSSGGRVCALIKPQFEAGREEVGKGGIVRDAAVRERVVRSLTEWARGYPLESIGVIPSPIQGRDGNEEFLWLLKKKVTVGVIVNGSKPGAKDVIYQVVEFAQSHPNLRLLFEHRTGRLINRSGLTETALAKRSDVLLVAGGDGSLIDVVNAVYPSQTPILGVNIGSLGFLTAVAATEVEKVLPYLAGMDLLLSPRLVLQTVVHHTSGKKHVIPCNLNDIVVTRVPASRLARIRVEVGDYLVTEYVCDGLIVSTPTGSTAYNLASGGPILSPDADSIVLTPICPHTLTNRALVVGTDEPIRVRVVKQPGVPPPGVQFDGRDGGCLHPHDWLEIKPAKAKVQLAYLPHTDFYRVLRQKLKWSGASV